ESIRLAEEVKSRLLIHNRNAFLYALNNDPYRLETRRTQRAQVTSLLETIGQLANSREEEAVLDNVETEISTYFEKRRELATSSLPPVEQYTRISQDVDEAIAVVDMLIEVNLEQMDSLMRAISRQNMVANSIAVLLLFLGGIVLLIIIIGILFSVARPLTSLAETIAQYAAGESSARTDVKGLQEIRVIASNFNSMADRLEERRQEQLRFIASIAHDLRNPLQSMSMASALLAMKCLDEDRELAGMVSRQVKHLDRLVGDLLDTSRVEAGQLELELGDQDIGSLVRDSVELYRAGSDLHSFRVEMPDSPIMCRCDGRRIAQVINNLISNAVKYSPNGGTVKVKALKNEDGFVISVADQGIGIAPGDLDRIFKPFYRTKATKGTIPGIGLGLSASRRIVEAHGGRLQVESEPGKGSVFYVFLPAG
ncbi:MAG TPA: HAMP domain-containing sensor histidine kinase, partial [Gammaproteobacteria bacterium]